VEPEKGEREGKGRVKEVRVEGGDVRKEEGRRNGGGGVSTGCPLPLSSIFGKVTMPW